MSYRIQDRMPPERRDVQRTCIPRRLYEFHQRIEVVVSQLPCVLQTQTHRSGVRCGKQRAVVRCAGSSVLLHKLDDRSTGTVPIGNGVRRGEDTDPRGKPAPS